MANSKAAKGRDARNTWILPTNHQNILFMLGNGLITGPDGFIFDGKSGYYEDALSICPGWIPLYKNSVPDEVKARAVSEKMTLMSAAAHISLDDYTGDVRISGKGGPLPYSEAEEQAACIWVPAPLPISWIREITLESESDREGFMLSAGWFNNADIEGINITCSPSNESGQQRIEGTADKYLVVDENAAPKQAGSEQAYGGIFALLYRLANKGEVCLKAFKAMRGFMGGERAGDYTLQDIGDGTDGGVVEGAGTGTGTGEGAGDPIVLRLEDWLAGENISIEDANGLAASFFYSLLSIITDKRGRCAPSSITAEVREELIARATEFRQSPDRNEQMLAESLLSMMSELDSPQSNMSDLFRKRKKTLIHALLLFFLRDSAEDLLEFQEKNPGIVLSEPVYVAAALLFGAREGWSWLPSSIKRGLRPWTTPAMAAQAHQSGSIALPQAPVPLLELFAGSEAWEQNEKYALKLAQKCKWSQCMQTRIKLPKTYCVEEGYMVLPGDVKASAIKTDVIRERFLEMLRDKPVDEKAELVLRAEIKGTAK